MMCKIYQSILYFLVASGVLFGFSMAMESDLIGITRDLGNLNRPTDIIHDEFSVALASDVLMQPQQKADVTQALMNTKEKRIRIKNSYRKIQVNWKYLKRRENDTNNPYLYNIKEALEYISILTRFKLQEIIAHELYRSVHLEPMGEIKIFKGSDVSTEVMKARILANLKGLLLKQVSENTSIETLFSRQILMIIEYLLKQSFISNHDSLAFFQEQKALDMMAEKIFRVFYGLHELEDLILSTDLLDLMLKHVNTSDYTLILQSLEAKEKKYLLQKFLDKFLDLYIIKTYMDDSQLEILEEGYQSLTKKRFNIQKWLDMRNNFKFINNNQEQLSEFFFIL
ncbi:expressed protein [Phakopsora pachyrhizi]|uniref:Expressed protein n=1 Tax=Phakopsora pachyrhizi TaxID=170000 RepID=A0AAV0BIU7_PHAPC|nr:expressed protein [Phakopsora pachyrhizi]